VSYLSSTLDVLGVGRDKARVVWCGWCRHVGVWCDDSDCVRRRLCVGLTCEEDSLKDV
jgi:hypothetical protein